MSTLRRQLFISILVILFISGIGKMSHADLNDGLVAYYPFNGNANDESRNENNGILNGTPTLVNDRFGNPGTAYSFDGIDDYIQIQASSSLNTGNTLTWSAWIYPNGNNAPNSILEINPGSKYSVHMYVYTGTATNTYYFGNDTNFFMANLVDINGNFHVLGAGDNTIVLKQWNQVALTYDGSIAKLFVNGALKDSLTFSANFETNSNYSIGHRISLMETNHYAFNGILDDIRIYNRAFSESEMQALYDSAPETPEIIPPTVKTGTAGSVTASSATINGTVNPNSTGTNYYFQYGKTTSYGSVTTTADAGSGSTDKTVSANLTGLSSNTTYHFRLVARNSAGTTNGRDQTFKTNKTAVTVGIDPPKGPVFVDKSNEPNNAPVYMGNIVTINNVATLSGQMELSVDFPAYNKPVDIWVIVALPDGRFYMADESGAVLSLDKGIFAIAEGVSGKSIKKQILKPFTTGVTGTAFDPWPASGLWWVCWLIAPDSGGDFMAAIANGKYELGFYIFDVNNNGTPSSGGEVTGPGGSVIHLPTGSSSTQNNISLISGDATDLVNEFQHAVSDVYQISIADADSATGDTLYTIDIPLTSRFSDPEKLALSVRLTSGTVVPVLGEYDQSTNAYQIHLNGLVSGWNMQVVEEPEASIITGSQAGGDKIKHTPRWATTTQWSPCDAWVFRLSAPPSPEEAIFDTELDSLKSAAEDLCQKYSAMGFREPQMWISSRYGGRVVNIAYKTKWGSYYTSSSIKDTPPVDEAELQKLGQIVIDYYNWTSHIFPDYGWLLKNTLAHELFHAVQWGYDIKYCFFNKDNSKYISIQSFTEGTATAMGMTYQEEGGFTGPDLWVRNGSPAPDILNGFGVSAPFNNGYPTQDFFVYVAKKYGKDSFAYLVDLFEELANQSKDLTPVILKTITHEEINAVYRKAMDISFRRSFKVGLSDVFTTYALDRAYHMTDDSNLRPDDTKLANNTLRADLFSNSNIPGSAASKDKPFKSDYVWPLSAEVFRIPAIPETNKASGKLPMVFSITDSTLGTDNVRIFIVPEAGGKALITQMIEVTGLDTPVDIPVTGADAVSVIIVGVITEKHIPAQYPIVTAYINGEDQCFFKEGDTFGANYGYLKTKFNACGEGDEQAWDLPLCYKLGTGGTIIPQPERCDMAEYNLVQESLTGSWSCNSIDLIFTSTVTTRPDIVFGVPTRYLTFTGEANITADISTGKLTKTTSGNIHQIYGTKECDKTFTTRY